jgi:Domain of unknown function (DUF4159)/A-macroglobulin TED domain
MGPSAAHPTDQTLQSYGLGKLDDQASKVIRRHLEVCPDCVRRVAGLSSDRSVGRLCQARGSDPVIAGGASPAWPTQAKRRASSAAPPPTATTEEQSALVYTAAEPVDTRAPWLWLAVVVAVGFAATVLLGITLLVKTLRPKTANGLPVILAEREAVDDPVERFEGSASNRDSHVLPVPVSPPSPDVSTPNQSGVPIPALPSKAPEPPPAGDLAQIPTQVPAEQPVAADVAKPKRIEAPPERKQTTLGQQVDRAIHNGVLYLKRLQHPNGSWSDVETEAKTGTTSLVTLALLAAGESLESPPVRKALEYLRGFGPKELHSTYAIALQTMVFAAADPDRDRLRMAANVQWLTNAQIKPGDPVYWPGSWTYSDSKRGRPGDNSNTQYALLGLFAASEVGVPVDPIVWELSHYYWEQSQKKDGSWAYTPAASNSTASMTCAGISGLIMARQGSLRAPGQEPSKKQSRVKVSKTKQGRRNVQGQEFLDGDAVRNCGNGVNDRNLQAGIDWLSSHFEVVQNFGNGQQWKFYYLYGLERVGRLAGLRFFDRNDWYQLGAQELVKEQHKFGGFWTGALNESEKVLATSFAILFLAKGRATVLINKLRHGRDTDWNNDPDDVRNIVGVVSRDWKTLLNWQVLDPGVATVSELLQAPIVYLNGHHSPDYSQLACERLRKYVDKGGFIFAEACCSRPEFDRGFKKMVKQIFPEKEYTLKPLSADHPLWRAKHQLTPDPHPLWGIDNGRRTVVIYSPQDLSCYWNQAAQSSANPAVMNSIKIAQNVIDHVTSRTVPPDKLIEHQE